MEESMPQNLEGMMMIRIRPMAAQPENEKVMIKHFGIDG